MKKIIGFTFLISLFLCSGQLIAQHNKLADTLLVFAIRDLHIMDTVSFRYIMKGRQISWWDAKGILHQARINGFTNDYMILDTAKVSFDSISRISTVVVKPEEKNSFFVQMVYQKSIPVFENQRVMRRIDYEKLLRWRDYKKKSIITRATPFPDSLVNGNKRNILKWT